MIFMSTLCLTNIGQGLINIFAPVLKVINIVMSKLRTLASYFKIFTEVFLGNNAGGGDSNTISAETAKAAQSSGTLAQNMSDANKSAKETQKSLQGFDEVHTLDNDSGSSSGAGANTSGIGDIGSGLSFGEPDTSGVTDSMNDIKKKLTAIKQYWGDKIKGIWDSTKGFRDRLTGCIKSIGKVFTIVFNSIQSSGLKNLKKAFADLGTSLKNLYDRIKPALDVIATVILYIVTLIVDTLIVVIGVLINLVLNAVALVVKAISLVVDAIVWLIDQVVWLFNNWQTVWNGIKGLVAAVCIAIVAYYVTLWNAIVNTFKNIGTWFSNKFTSAYNAVQKAWNGAGQFFTGVWNNIKGAFSNVVNWFESVFSKAWQAVLNVFNAGGQIFVGIKNGIVGVFQTVVNGLIDGINKVIKIPFEKINDALNSIRDISILGAKPFSGLWGKNPISIPQIPKLAQGGIVNRATLAMVGEAGTEAVMPLKNNTQWIGNLAGQISEKMNSNSQGGAMNVQFMLNSKKFAQATIKDFEAEANRKGGLKVKLV